MSLRQITRLALVLAAVSIVGMLLMLVMRPDWGLVNWAPALGLGLAILLLVLSFLRGAYLTAQRRVAMVDKLNDCYTGVADTGDSVTQTS
jgi:hypothetical protein